MRFKLPGYSLERRPLRVVAAMLPLAFYIGGFGLLTSVMGPSAAVVGFAAVAVVAWLWGAWIGALGGLLMGAASPFLYAYVQQTAPTVGNAGAPIVVAIGLGVLVGYLRDLRYQLVEQNATIRHHADRDGLTGLLNRVSLMRELEKLIELSDTTSDVFGVLFLDLDRFKVINDTLGHAAGDQLLRSVASRMTEHTRGGDLLGRLGGDEFVAVLKGTAKAEGAMTVAHHLLTALATPHDVGNEAVKLQASIGISLYPRDGHTAEDLISRADNAMYRVKWQGKNGARFFGEGGREEARRLILYRSLRSAIEHEEVTLAYQPIIDLASGKVAAVEALLRWTHPEVGPVAPPTAIELAAELGLTAALGRVVLARACRDAAQWPRVDGRAPIVSVNVSPTHVAQPGFADVVQQVLAETGLRPQRLGLELTEEALLQHRDAALTELARLKELGVRIAIDDFGVGYSSLAYLRELPADVLKLDRVFIQALDATPEEGADDVVRAVVSLGHALGKVVVAEGVETRGQFESVTGIGCDMAQGYFIARPAPLASLDLPSAAQVLEAVRQAADVEAGGGARVYRLGS